MTEHELPGVIASSINALLVTAQFCLFPLDASVYHQSSIKLLLRRQQLGSVAV